ncbi:MAG TPA: RNA polymerase sigma factor [Gemmatimonadales bacterium]|nr:RNA polymerase sigma factor [Gemmatimonadales bacterium]
MKQVLPHRHIRRVSPAAAANDVHDSDEVLMERLRLGNVRAFDTLFERYANAIHRFLTLRVGDHARAEDLTQETFLSLVRARDRYGVGRSFRQWLYAIASNAARHELRTLRREGARLQQIAASSSSATSHDSEDERAVRRALALLPESQREVIVLHSYAGMTFAEIADVLGSGGIAVRVRAHRGYRRLRELLGGVEGKP